MAHTYIITSINHMTGSDEAIVNGTVDGFPVSANFNFSSLATFPNATKAQSFLANIMLVVFNQQQPLLVNNAFNGSITQ